MISVGFDEILAPTYRQYLQRLDARALLAHYGAQNCTELSGADGTTEIVHSCLLDRIEPHHSSADMHPSAACNIDRRLYVCYALGWGGDLIRFVQKMEGQESLTDALGVLRPFLAGITMETATFTAEIDRIFAGSPGRLELPAYSPRVLQAWDQPHSYWSDRGISDDACRLLKLGYDAAERRIVFPVMADDGSLVGWQKRAIPGVSVPEYPKYRSSSGLPRSEVLYGLHLVPPDTDRVIVVESPMSVARAHSLGVPGVVATLGAKVSRQQLDFLKKFSQVVVWFDDDPAGRAGARKTMEGLYRHVSVVYVTPERGKDLADYASRDEVDQMVANAEPVAVTLGRWDAERATRLPRKRF